MRMMHVAGALALLCVLSAVPARAQENWTPIAPLELYKPDYFLMGQPDTKIQLSLKIRLLEDENLFFGYSQLMKWELFRSDPYFADIDYNPEFFYRFKVGASSTAWVDVGPFEHESNGKGGAQERSWNRTYARVHEEWNVGDEAVLRGEFKAWVPYSLNASNRNLADYRGLYELNLTLSDFMGRFYDVDDMILRLYPGGPSEVDPTHGGQELTWRVRAKFRRKFRPVITFQVFHGFAESMLDYRHSYWAWRAGIGF